MKTLSSIKRLHRLAEKNLFLTSGNLDYPRTLEVIAKLSEAVEEYTGDGEEIWFIEGMASSPADVLIGTFWHLYEWSAGQASRSYEVSCIVGRIFSPGFSDGPEPDSCEEDVYSALADMAENYYK
jgi:hypothetical protein